MALELAYSLTNLLYTFVISLVITSLILRWFRERNYPPGPMGVPILGYSVFMGKKPNEKLRELSKTYGDIFSFSVGSNLFICIHDSTTARELVTNPDMLFRPEHFTDFMVGRGGFGGMNGEEWQEQRRFSFYTMRNLGMGKGLWESMIQDSVVDFTEELKSTKGQPTNLEDALSYSNASNGISLLLGRPLDKVKDAKNIKIIRECTREFMKFFGQVSLNSSLPWLRKFMEVFHLAGYDKFYGLLRQFEAIFRKEVDERLKSPETWTKEDYIGCYLKELEKREKQSEDHYYSIENLMGNLAILFIASNDSTFASVSWLLLLMAHHQDIQKKVHEEIDSVSGKDRVISFDDKARFPYTMATIFEMLRWVAIAPLFPPRLVMEDMKIKGYTIPKGSLILINVWSIMRDPREFKDPTAFTPERFLSENDNKLIKNMEGFIPFSVGKRNCPGEGVAIMTIFLYFVSIMQKFKVTTPPGKSVNLEPIFGGAHLPHPQDLCFLDR